MCLWRYAPPCPSSSAAVSPEPSRTACLHLHLDSANSSSTNVVDATPCGHPRPPTRPFLPSRLRLLPRADLLRVVYGDDGFFFRRFHAETGECEDAVVPPPGAHHRLSRRAIFSKRMTVPNPVEKLFGASAADVIAGVPRFEETQWIKYDPARGVASVRSLPARQLLREGSLRHGGARHVSPFATRDVERCAMVAKLTVSAAGTWGLQHAVEKLMEHRAKSSFREWARWTDDFLSNITGDERRDAPLPTLAPFFAGEESEGADGEEGRGWGREGEPRTPARPRRADAFGEDFGDEPGVDTPPRERDVSARDGRRDRDGVAPGRPRTSVAPGRPRTTTSSSTTRGRHTRRRRSSPRGEPGRRTRRRTRRTKDAPNATGTNRGNARPDEAPTERNDADEDVVSGAVASVSGAVASASVPSPSWRRLLTGRPSPARGRRRLNLRVRRAGDAFRDGWFMRTVMKDLSALRASAEDQRATCASLEENVAALRAESAALRAEMRRYAARAERLFREFHRAQGRCRRARRRARVDRVDHRRRHSRRRGSRRGDRRAKGTVTTVRGTETTRGGEISRGGGIEVSNLYTRSPPRRREQFPYQVFYR